MRLNKSMILASLFLPLALTHSAMAENDELKADTHKSERSAGVMPEEAIYLDVLPDDGRMASALIGSAMRSAIENDEVIGEVKDIVVNGSGQIVAVVVGVGSYLGGGEKNVAIEWTSVELDSQDGDPVLRANVSKEALGEARAQRHY